MVYGLWSMVYGLWSMVYCLWSMVYGLYPACRGPRMPRVTPPALSPAGPLFPHALPIGSKARLDLSWMPSRERPPQPPMPVETVDRRPFPKREAARNNLTPALSPSQTDGRPPPLPSLDPSPIIFSAR